MLRIIVDLGPAGPAQISHPSALPSCTSRTPPTLRQSRPGTTGTPVPLRVPDTAPAAAVARVAVLRGWAGCGVQAFIFPFIITRAPLPFRYLDRDVWKVFEEKTSGKLATADRPDLLTVQEVDRLGCNLLEGLIVLNDLFQQGIGVKVLEGIGAGEHTERSFILDLALALAGDRRRDIVKKTKDGLEAARRQGKVGGRRPVVDDDKRAAILDRHRRGNPSAPSPPASRSPSALSTRSSRQRPRTPPPTDHSHRAHQHQSRIKPEHPAAAGAHPAPRKVTTVTQRYFGARRTDPNGGPASGGW
ncbi:recombinase family protein [Actinomadura formosensis]|uniref:recombinase family protein n=1 Tax=Actinomadura formosensis TaxID=60706 RepID=UPI00278C7011|nr:recombinase family protein [Actinomadura formosensis]